MVSLKGERYRAKEGFDLGNQLRLLGQLFFYNLEMQQFSGKGLRIGLGIRGIVGAILLGFICLYQPLFGNDASLTWAKILLVLAAAVYPAVSKTLLYFSLESVYDHSMAEKKVTGPASYFPSIEKKYGKPIEHWMKELKKVSKLAHMEQVAHLKEKFEMGHGHANAIVAVFRQKNGLQGDSSFNLVGADILSM